MLVSSLLGANERQHCLCNLICLTFKRRQSSGSSSLNFARMDDPSDGTSSGDTLVGYATE